MKFPRIRLWKMTILVALFATFFAFASWCARLGVVEIAGITPSESDLHSMGDRLVAGIEKWRLSHGRYPRTLAEAGLESPTIYKGGFRYSCDSEEFSLSIGEADGMNFMHTYHSRADKYHDQEWYCMD